MCRKLAKKLRKECPSKKVKEIKQAVVVRDVQESSVLSLHFTGCRGKTNNMGSVSAKWGEGGGGP